MRQYSFGRIERKIGVVMTPERELIKSMADRKSMRNNMKHKNKLTQIIIKQIRIHLLPHLVKISWNQPCCKGLLPDIYSSTY